MKSGGAQTTREASGEATDSDVERGLVEEVVGTPMVAVARIPSRVWGQAPERRWRRCRRASPDDDGVGADLDSGDGTQDLRAGTNHDMVAHGGVTLARRHRHPAERNVEDNNVPDLGGLTSDDSVA